MLNNNQLASLKERMQEVGLDLENERARTRLAYKEKEAREQFKRLLVNAKLFEKITTEEERATRNFAIEILQDMGFLDSSNISRVIDMLFTLPILGEEEN